VYDILVNHIYDKDCIPWPPEHIKRVGESGVVGNFVIVNERDLEDDDQLITITIEER
jgi:hypothetical protein